VPVEGVSHGGRAAKVNWVLDAGIRGFFRHLDRGWLEGSSGTGSRMRGSYGWSRSG
jgi:hypothetical protein